MEACVAVAFELTIRVGQDYTVGVGGVDQRARDEEVGELDLEEKHFSFEEEQCAVHRLHTDVRFVALTEVPMNEVVRIAVELMFVEDPVAGVFLTLLTALGALRKLRHHQLPRMQDPQAHLIRIDEAAAVDLQYGEAEVLLQQQVRCCILASVRLVDSEIALEGAKGDLVLGRLRIIEVAEADRVAVELFRVADSRPPQLLNLKYRH